MNNEKDEPTKPTHIETGGAYVGGDVETGGGPFIGRDQVIEGDLVKGDKIVIASDQAHDVNGLANPYLGLSAFTFDDRRSYTGRELLIEETVRLLTRDGAEQTLLFVIGASGSGKSSLALAGLLPALEDYYATLKLPTQRIDFRPGTAPLSALIKRLPALSLQISGEDVSRLTPVASPARQVNLLVIDQFEELFTQAEPQQRGSLIQLLEHLSPFATLATHIIVTMRSDYLGELFDYRSLYDLAKGGVDLREMDEAGLRASIQRPLQVLAEENPGYRGKAWEPALVEELAHEAAPSATYLPLLQLTLQELWRRGRLTLGAYYQAGRTLTSAIRDRATTVLEYADYDRSRPTAPRPQADRETIMRIFLDLIHVELAAGASRPLARRRRTLEALVGDGTSPLGVARARLIDDLVRARLLSIERQSETDYVEVIHESLIANWDHLEQTIVAEREILEKRARFERAVFDWRDHVGDLLAGIRLAEARSLEEHDDISLREPDAREFLEQSKAQFEADLKQRKLAESQYFAETLRQQAEDIAKLIPGQPLEALRRAVRTAGSNLDSSPDRLLPSVHVTLYAAVRAAKESRMLLAHSAPVRAVAFSPDGQLTASAGDDRLLHVWNLTQGRKLATLIGHRDSVSAVSFSPDGQRIVSGSGDGTLRLWALNGQPLGLPITGHQDSVTAVAFRPQGDVLASASNDRTVRLWDITGNELACLQGHEAPITTVIFSPDGNILASGSIDGMVRMWDLHGQEIGHPFRADEDFVGALAFHPSGEVLASVGGEGVVHVYDLKGREVCVPLEGHEGFINAIAFSPAGDTIITASDDRTVRVWDLRGGQIGTPLYGHESFVTSLVIHSNSGRIATGSADKTVRIWEWPSYSGHAPGASASGLAESMPERGQIPGRKLCLWDLYGDQVHAGWHADGSFVRTVAITPDAQIVGGGGDQTVRVWDLTGRQVAEMKGHTATIATVAVSPNGRLIASGSRDGSLRLWGVDGRSLGVPFDGHREGINALAFGPDGEWVVSASNDTTLILWDLTGRRIIGPLLGHESYVNAVAVSPHGQIVSASGDGILLLWDHTGRRIAGPFRGHENDVNSVAFSPDGQSILSGGADGTVRIWDLDGHQLGDAFLGHTDRVETVAFSPGGELILSAGRDGTLRQRDREGNLLVRPFQIRRGYLFAAAYSIDGNLIVTGGSDGLLRIWPAASWRSLLRAACQRLQGHPTLYMPDSTEQEICQKYGASES